VPLRLRPGLHLALALAACSLAPAAAGATPEPKPKPAAPKPPCPGCTLDAFGDRATKVPLLVVLHGDHEQASIAAARWRAAAKQRGWVLLSLQCPAAEKCKTSWWQWNGDPQWVRDRVADVAAQISIDPERMFVAGWSGGATYLGLRAPAWHDTFAAVVIHGGGMAPRDEPAECPARPVPAYFLVGDKNPLHSLAQDLREYLTRCKQEIRWDLVAGADHPKEAAALDGKRALAVLDWLAAHPRVNDRQSSPHKR
jgi:poly(3-hydroxybutyrate) depolymerase